MLVIFQYNLGDRYFECYDHLTWSVGYPNDFILSRARCDIIIVNT